LTEWHQRIEEPIMTSPDSLLLAITPANSLVHVARAAELLEHVVDEDVVVEDAGGQALDWEFYDIVGIKQVVTRNDEGRATGFEPAGQDLGPKFREFLVDRIMVFQAKVQVLLDRQHADGRWVDDLAAGDPFVRFRAPVVTGELADVLTALEVLGASKPPGQPDRGSWLHNAWHAVVG
jgi:hypothetical protein